MNVILISQKNSYAQFYRVFRWKSAIFFLVNLTEEYFKILICPLGASWVGNICQEAVNNYYWFLSLTTCKFLLFLPAASVFSLKKFRFRRDNLSLFPRRILRLVRHTGSDLLHKILHRKVLNLRLFKNKNLSIKTIF